MRTIELVNGRGTVLVDDEDYETLSEHKWYVMAPKRSRVCYATTSLPRSLGGARVTMHVMLLGRRDGLQVDHVDGNGLNNQRANLRFATRGQNRANAPAPRSNRSGFKGVAVYPGKPNPYRAFACVSGKTVYLGSFPTPELAHVRYLEEARRIYGAFARAE